MALTARLLLRASGLAGVVVALGGVLAVVAATRPWFTAVAEVAMLGVEQNRAVAALTGVPDTPGGWLTLAAGLVAVVLGAAAALDRPPASTRTVLLGCALLLVSAAGWAWVGPGPSLARVAGGEGDQLLDLAGRLPSGVDLQLSVRAAMGPVLSAVAAVMVAVGTLAARDL